jgi:hypothetical protein
MDTDGQVPPGRLSAAGTVTSRSQPQRLVRSRGRQILLAALVGIGLVGIGLVAWTPVGDQGGVGAGVASSAATGVVRLTPPRTRTSPPTLAWAPPRLVDPQTVVVDSAHNSLNLDPARDYHVILPSSASTVLVNGLTIAGGHNVVVIGGVIAVPAMAEYPDKGPDHPKDMSLARRGLYLKGQTGTIHIEGVHLTGDLSDAINLDERQGAVVQLENLRIDLVHGGRNAHHADVIQSWAGPRILRVDGLLAATQYQGLFLLPNQWFKDGPEPQSFTFRRTTITMLPGSGYGLWLPKRNPPWLDWSGITLRPTGQRRPDKLSWPDDRLGLQIVDDTATVDLPAGTPGGTYASPGYAAP